MNLFFEPVNRLSGVEKLNKTLDKKGGRTVLVSGCIETQKVHFASAVADKYAFQVIVTYDEAKMRQIYEDSCFFNRNTVCYPAKDAIFYSADVHGNQITGERIKCIAKILEAIGKRWSKTQDIETQDIETQDSEIQNGTESSNILTIVTTIDGLSDMLIPLERYRENVIVIDKTSVIDTEELARKLVHLGFERCGMVEHTGQFAIRGGIIDIFSFTDEAPVRIELWDDEVDSIRSFDVESQRSIENLKEYRVFPATEYIFSDEEIRRGMERVYSEKEDALKAFGIESKRRTKEEIEAGNHINRLVSDVERTGNYERFMAAIIEKPVGFASYFPADDTLFVFDEPDRIKERSKLAMFEYSESMKNRLQAGYVLPCQTAMVKDLEEITAGLDGNKILVLETLDYTPEYFKPDYQMQITVKGVSSYNNSFEYLSEDLAGYRKNGYGAVLVCSSRTRAMRIVDDLGRLGIPAFFSEDFNKKCDPGMIIVTYGSIHKGFEYPLISFVVIAENDIFTQRKISRHRSKRTSGKEITSFNELNVGDYVVHENYGLGIYKGIEKIKVEGVEKDYIKIDYAGNSSLYVLATQLDRVQKYSGADTEKKPKINKLGTQEWENTKSKVNRAVEEIAKDLVELYAVRQQIEGYQFGEDTVWQKEFEEMFPYEETSDQLNAIEDTKRDMESKKVMDRLICGDVGYGKTEVAIRAAFKAVQEGKQVAYLVPTTVLASQHFDTFEQRMKNFPVTVAQLSSFRTAAQNKETIKELKKGMVDVVIGTHRLLSADVSFKDLGLLIIDEEQRFGVSHKEKIKKLKQNIDVLTLSATPIPRTLHMSLVGIRDMSVLTQPPVDRIPIQTFVTEHNDEMIREAINRELSRNGQVYYVYNRVKNIEDMAFHIQELVPDATVAYAHGQMDKRELEKIMHRFINKEIDVLVSTTIIETGMDISNCNTMIIEDADKFGLSQLYQLRGRVGRSNRTAYAFLLYRRDRMLTEVAEKRLSAIREFSDFGSGFKIAMKDLEIRGAGNVLGKSQHGHMSAVGYDLYCKMLNQAVNNLKGIRNEYGFETTVEMELDAYIPSTYIKSEYQKLDIYKRIATIETREEMSDMQDELTDRYGELPGSAWNLLMVALIKAKAHKIGFTEIKGGMVLTSFEGNAPSSWKTVMTIYPKADIRGDNVENFVKGYGGALEFKTHGSPYFVWCVTKRKYSNAREYLNGLLELIESMEEHLTVKK
ncbi:MAG: transcription-repair coupling factor [Lachnospira sp.]